MIVDPAKLPYRPCVGVMVLNREGLVWLGQRADTPDEPEGDGAWWQMPQGGIDDSEEARRAALRELREETGIGSVEIVAEMPGWQQYDLPTHLIGHAWGGRYRGQRQKWFAVRFLGDDSEVNITPPAGHRAEFDHWRWTPLTELVGRVVPFKRAVYRAVVAAFAPLAKPDPAPSHLPYRPCVGIALINRDGLVWVGRRQSRWLGSGVGPIWQMPQGGIHRGEEPEQAAVRELQEETGVADTKLMADIPGWLAYDLPTHLVGIALKGRYRGQRQRWFAMRFLGLDSEIDIGPHAGEKPEFDDWRWARFDELSQLVVPFKRPIYEVVTREFAPLAHAA